MFHLMIWGNQDLHETIMMWNHRKRKELFRLHCNASSGKKIGDFSLDTRNCPVAQGMASGQNFQNGTVESWDVFWRTLLCVQKSLYDTEFSHPSDVLEPFQCGDMPPAAPCITVPVGNWKDSSCPCIPLSIPLYCRSAWPWAICASWSMLHFIVVGNTKPAPLCDSRSWSLYCCSPLAINQSSYCWAALESC